ncbi:MAG: S41 family peptidase [Crocinitomicaceae bacterium]|nr:S41 family peptidase [Crocinitomicaceae bacterium]
MIKFYFFLITSLFIVQSKEAFGQSREFEILKNLELIDQVHEHLELYFVDEPQTGKISKVAIDAMLKELDPYTVFYHESNMEDYRLMTTGEYGGIGALIRSIKGDTYIVEPYEGKPAQTSGLKAGDKIISIEGIQMTAKTSEQVSTALKGPKGSSIKIEVERRGIIKSFIVEREQIKIPDVPYSGMIDDNIAYVKLSSFSQTAFQSVQSEYQKLQDEGMRYAILDLRNNGGGLLFEAVKIVNLFVPKGELVVYTKGRVEKENREFITREVPLFPDIPLVVLINENSASASEIVAGSLQDMDRAVIIGQQSFGKGLVQRTYDLKYGSKLKVTISKYYTPSGRCVQRLEYYDRNIDNAPEEISDSLIRTFKTKNGRDVIDGRGIVPDKELIRNTFSELTSEIIINDLIFEFVNQYVSGIDSVSGPKEFELGDDGYNGFISFVETRPDFKYSTIVEKKLIEIKEILQKDSIYSDVQAAFSNLEKIVKTDLLKDLERYKTEIAPLIENEIVARFYFQKGKTVHSFSFSDVIKESRRILKTPSEYAKILNQ